MKGALRPPEVSDSQAVALKGKAARPGGPAGLSCGRGRDAGGAILLGVSPQVC